MFKWLNNYINGDDDAWIERVKETESGKWLSPKELLGVQTQGDADIALALITRRKREGCSPYWWVRPGTNP